MTDNILSYFINKFPLCSQINTFYTKRIIYNEETLFRMYIWSDTINIHNYEKNIYKTSNEINTSNIRRVYKWNYKGLYYNNDNYILSHAKTYINYLFNNKNKYLIKYNITYNYKETPIYTRAIVFRNNFKYMKKTLEYCKKYEEAHIFCHNKYELFYYSNIFLIY